jgi:molybdenum cofactor biosynthesis protein B
MGVHEHKKEAPKSVSMGIISVSSTRALIDDTSGRWIREQAEKKGHKIVFHRVIPDDANKIATPAVDGSVNRLKKKGIRLFFTG